MLLEDSVLLYIGGKEVRTKPSMLPQFYTVLHEELHDDWRVIQTMHRVLDPLTRHVIPALLRERKKNEQRPLSVIDARGRPRYTKHEFLKNYYLTQEERSEILAANHEVVRLEQILEHSMYFEIPTYMELRVAEAECVAEALMDPELVIFGPTQNVGRGAKSFTYRENRPRKLIFHFEEFSRLLHLFQEWDVPAAIMQQTPYWLTRPGREELLSRFIERYKPIYMPYDEEEETERQALEDMELLSYYIC